MQGRLKVRGSWGCVCNALIVLAFFLPTEAAAQVAANGSLNAQIFAPPPGQGSTFLIERPQVLSHLGITAGLATSLADEPLGVSVQLDPVDESTRTDRALVDWLWQTELLATVGLFEWMELGFALPLVVANTTTNAENLAASPAYDTVVRAGDTRLYVKVPILRGRFALAGRLVVGLPSGDDARFVGNDYWTTYPNFVASYRVGPVMLAAELGYRLVRPSQLGALEIDDELQMSLGANYAFHRRFSAIVDAQLRVGVAGNSVDEDEIPAEVFGGGRWRAPHGFSVDVGAGTGISDGYGAPRWRVFALLRYTYERRACPAGPEDFDGYQDNDFCRDADNDGDRVEDEFDECPNDSEDRDSFLDRDGCPDVDNDADGVSDEADHCPFESEDRDGFEDQDGCPEADNDQDGVPDGLDACPMEPEDLDRYQDRDGCPEPGPKRATITVTNTRILISERIYFDFDQDTVRSVSIPLLKRVAQVIKNLPKRKLIRVEGYTDASGDPEHNKDLSYRRARAVVEYLRAQGVPRSRLSYTGYGSAVPVAPNDTPEGAALNRRVEFTIIDKSRIP